MVKHPSREVSSGAPGTSRAGRPAPPPRSSPPPGGDSLTAGLNPSQAEAVRTLAGPLLVLAGAGTGKTRVVTYRIANLIRHGTSPDRILAVTFTNKASGEMQERVGQLLGYRRRKGRKSPRPTISTFHAHCVRILRQHAPAIGFPKNFGICDRADQESIARGILRELRLPGTAIKPSEMLAILSGWKNASVRPRQAATLAATDKEHFAAAGYRRYQDALRARGAMDFDDLLLHTEQLLSEHAEIRQQESERFEHVLVDEYQDTNGSQYRITRHLTLSHRNLCVVGDDDQSIYAWRGADVSHILNFRDDWPDAKIVWLEENYRSTAAILDMANRLIAFNSQRHEKVLRPSRPAGQRPRILQHKDETKEAERTVAEIRHLIDNEHIQPRDIAILFRTNEQPRLFETALRTAGVPYVMLGSQSFFDRREIRDLIAFLKWIDQPDDELSLLRIVNTPPRGLSGATVKLMVQRAVERGVPVWRVMRSPSAISDLATPARRGIEQLDRLAADVRQRAGESLTAAFQTLITQTAYADEIARLYDQPEERDARMLSISDMANAISAYEDQNPDGDLSGFLSEIALAGREMGSEKDKLAMKNSVWLLTMHAAKGLEFPVVYMVGLEEGILPHSRSVKSGREEDIAEERRLCYVGVTRAQERLTLSMALTRRKWGKPRPTTPSPFLYELTGKAENPNRYRSRRRPPSRT